MFSDTLVQNYALNDLQANFKTPNSWLDNPPNCAVNPSEFEDNFMYANSNREIASIQIHCTTYYHVTVFRSKGFYLK